MGDLNARLGSGKIEVGRKEGAPDRRESGEQVLDSETGVDRKYAMADK